MSALSLHTVYRLYDTIKCEKLRGTSHWCTPLNLVLLVCLSVYVTVGSYNCDAMQESLLIDDVYTVNHLGIEVMSPDGPVTAHAMLLACSVDLPA